MPKTIVVDSLSKRYRLGKLKHETMLREVLVNAVKHPFRRMRSKQETIWALKDVGFSVERGEVVGIIGRNGAGKSTLLKVLSRITYPTSGTMHVQGRVSSLLEVGTGFHEELTGRENVFLNGSILGMKAKEIKRKLDSIIDFAGVERFVDTPIKRYSSGMKLRLGFAVAAHLDPDVLFVDEVLAVGDADFQKRCLDTMDDMSRGGRTVLFVSHNMAAVDNLCPRAIWIEAGALKADGNTKEIIRDYLSSFAQAQQTGYDLSAIESRAGNGMVRYTGVEFLDADGHATSLFRTGEALRMRLYFNARDTVPNPHFGVQIYSSSGTLVTMTSTWETRLEIPRIAPGDGFVDLEIRNLNLVPARYYLSLWIQSIGPVKYDIIDHCVSLDVEASDVHETGRGLDSRWGVVIFPVEWRFGGATSGSSRPTREVSAPGAGEAAFDL
jgi:lipopolysaccharide transport system ATP-binding protein